MHNRYAAHGMCRHPNRVTAPGDNWTNYTNFVPCPTTQRALRHNLGGRNPEELYCSVVPYVAVIDWNLAPFCAGCELGTDNRTVNSAPAMYADFETKKNQWVYRGRLSEEETQAIQDDIDDLLEQHDDETLRGPYNNSYFVLRELLDQYTARWDAYVDRKVEDDRQRAQQQRQEDEMYRQAVQRSRSSASDEDDFAVEFEEEEGEASGSQASDSQASGSQSHSGSQPGSSSHSRHHGQQHGSSSRSSGKQSRTGMWTQFFGGKRRKR